jgi:hypothetical protein
LAHAGSLRHNSLFATLKFRGFLHSFKEELGRSIVRAHPSLKGAKDGAPSGSKV